MCWVHHKLVCVCVVRLEIAPKLACRLHVTCISDYRLPGVTLRLHSAYSIVQIAPRLGCARQWTTRLLANLMAAKADQHEEMNTIVSES